MAYPKIDSPAALERFRGRAAEAEKRFRARVLVCTTGCRSRGSLEICQALRTKLAAAGLDREIAVVEAGCHGQCSRAPAVLIEPCNYLYGGVSPDDAAEIIETTLRGGRPVERLCDKSGGKPVAEIGKVPFYRMQKREVLAHCGRVDPRRIEDAVARGAYEAAAKALSTMSPELVIEEVREAGIRGRGGAGFPTGIKWGLCRKAAGAEKYLICNADEGDPGAFMDRAVLEGVPHQVLEGMIIAAYAIGASRGFVYVRAEYPIAVENVGLAISQARECGLLGKNILGSGFDFDLEVRMGAGAFVCGEETALIASLEGRRGMPRARPPFPANHGYMGKPTTINNVETLANLPLLVTKGRDWYKAIGTPGNAGTKIFALAGKVNNTGLVEVPMGVTLRRIIYDIGGGIARGRSFKAAQTGGPSGGCIPARFLDLPIDYDSLKKIGAIMGSGGLIVMDENTCMVDMARFFMDFVQKESCGKCVPCRVGTRHMLDILTRICSGRGEEGDIERLEDLGREIKSAALCGLGQTAPNPVLTTIKYFREEYDEHIRLKHCRAAACEALAPAPCAHACPAGVNVPQYVALVAEGRMDAAVDVIRRRNPFVSVCGRVCDHPCESRCRRADLDEPLAIRALKRFAADQAAKGAGGAGGTGVSPVAVQATAGAGVPPVAIVGAGPAGLSCAYFLALMGRKSVVFEAERVPGGMLALGIPEYRLPKSILAADIEFILRHGVELRTATRVGSLDELKRQGFKAVFLATGAQAGRPLGIEGEDAAGVMDALALLRDRGLGRTPGIGKRVLVVGGGNAAVDAARSAMRLGAEKVTILYRRTREEMPAYEDEVAEALKEKVELVELAAPKRIMVEGGRCVGVEAVRMRLGDADADGRRRLEPIQGSEFVVECDTVLPAIGQTPSSELFPAGGTGVSPVSTGGTPVPPALSGNGTVSVDMATLETSVRGVFAGGDVTSGGGTVIEAIAAGQRAACAIDRRLGGKGRLPPDVTSSLGRPEEEAVMAAVERPREPMLAVSRRKGNFDEVVRGLAPARACKEAGRCLRCDLEKQLD